ncbi:Lcl C-terminal domain-containing protein [Stenotrophomonas acidaminiphila]
MSGTAALPRFQKIVPTPPPVHETVLDTSTGLEWQAIPFADSMKHADAVQACAELRLGGHDDWRLPTRAELLTLVDDTRYSPAIDTDAFPNTPNTWFWTSTAYAGDKDCAWFVGFDLGGSAFGGRDSHGRVRAVRGPARQSSASLER